MQRRGENGQPVKERRTLRPKAGKAPTARPSTPDLQEQVAALTHELTEAREQLTEALEYQTATGEVLNVISRSPIDVQPVFDMIAESAARLCEGQFCFVYRFDGQLLHFVAHRSLTPEVLEMNRRAYPAAPSRRSAAARAILERGFVQIPDINADPDYALGAMSVVGGYRSVVAVPILRDGLPIGSIAVARAPAGLLPNRQVELLKTFADQAAIAIENVRLFNETKEALEQQTATSEVLKVISNSASDLQTVFETMAENAVRLCDAERAYVFRFDGKLLRAVATYNVGPENKQFVLNNPIAPGRYSVSGRAALERRTVQVPDVQADPDFAYAIRDVDPIRTVLAVPMLKGDDLIGTITIYRLEVKPFTDKQVALIETFADQAVIAIENTRLLNELRQRTADLSKSLEELRTTQDRLVQTQKLALLGQLTAGIAHEIKNPLNFVNNFSGISAELIDELRDTLKGVPLDNKARAEIGELADTLKGNFDKVVHHGRRADAIVKNMLQHSRDGTGEHRVVDINALVEESLNLAWHGARAEMQGFEIKLKQSFDPSAGGADVFPQDIRRALLNLIANGFYAASRRRAETGGGDYEPTLTASTKNLGDCVEIRIRDNGTGITPDVKEKMFEPFFTTKPTGEGTGLGLSISHDIIVKQHGGSIEVDTKPGAFAEIRVILPRVAALLS